MTEIARESSGLRLPAEWEPHEACWLAWPSDRDLWGADLAAAQHAVAELALAIAAAGELVHVLVGPRDRATAAPTALAHPRVQLRPIPFGDIWLRDTGPLFVRDGGVLTAACFRFNGWGGKYLFPEDTRVARRIAAAAGVPRRDFPFILEGGALEVDGCGTAIATRQCLLHPNRGGAAPSLVEARLRDALGINRVVWLERGLANDHTDGHVDTLARFVAPGQVVCMEAQTKNDPNRDVLGEVAAALTRCGLEVVPIPSPGRVAAPDGTLLPASYLNFYIANEAVIVPIYGAEYDEGAVRALAALFPSRRVVALDGRAILRGGGAFHCITQQQPRAAVLR